MTVTRPSDIGSELRRGIRMPFEGIRLIFRSPRLLRLAVLPALITLSVALGALFASLRWGQGLLGHFWALPTACDDCSWYAWVWTRIELGAWHLAWGAAILLATMLSALVTSRTALAILMDELARATLEASGLTLSAAGAAWLKQLGRAVRRTLVLFLGYAVLWLVSFVPGAAAVTTPVGFAWTLGWLYVDNCTYALQWLGNARLTDVVRTFRQRPWLGLGFFLSSSALLLIPVAGLVATPIVVVGASLYVEAVQSEATPALVTTAASATV